MWNGLGSKVSKNWYPHLVFDMKHSKKLQPNLPIDWHQVAHLFMSIRWRSLNVFQKLNVVFCSHGSMCVNLLFYKDQSLTRCGPSSFEVCLIRKLNPAAPNINQTCLLLYLPVSFHYMHILRLFWAYTANSYFYKSDLS